MKSLENGNYHQVTVMKDGKDVKLYLEAIPVEHRVNLTNYNWEAQQFKRYKGGNLRMIPRKIRNKRRPRRLYRQKSNVRALNNAYKIAK
ncbi:hypothetical protein KHS38_01325 [Mucilaginibacter sp. Bleaf8]|uniref:hypothetical protein n=1 Tax=Mucilaginibacter sp. Bleaf8 TaxID=2834430 RepID=UPI001BCFE08C|nr:hypothetical protein [Mucilaginibacter sp. Bleaf8]MBS7563031.1 hypothetical protein [Mucilaginibacter sp. Bleaf8]